MTEMATGLGPKDIQRIESLGFNVEEPIGFRDQAPFVVDGSSAGQSEVDRSMHGNKGFDVRFGSPDAGRVFVEIVPTEEALAWEVFDARERKFVPPNASNSVLFGHKSGREYKKGVIRLSRIVRTTINGQQRTYLVGGHFKDKGQTWEVSRLKAVRLSSKVDGIT